MKSEEKRKLEILKQKAVESEADEALELILKRDEYQISIGSRMNSDEIYEFFIEIVVDILSSNRADNIIYLDRVRNLLQELEKVEYQITSKQDGVISFEREIPEENIFQRLDELKENVTDILKEDDEK